MTVVTICMLCQHSNKHGSTRCYRCGHSFDTPTEIVRVRLRENIYRSDTLFNALLITDIALLASLLIVFSVAAPILLVIMSGLTMRAKQHRDMWRHSETLLAEKHPELPKASVVSQ
jgi:uncharacterized membrane protein YvbJ